MGLKWKPLVAAILVAACSPKPEPPRETIRFVYAENAEPATVDRSPHNMETITYGAAILTHLRMPADGNHPVDAVHFRDSENKVIHPSVFYSGSFKSLCAQSRFLLVADDVFGPGPSFLMSSEGEKLATLDLGPCPSISASGDHKVFWAQTHASQPANTRVRAFDFSGNQLADETFTEKGQKLEVTFDAEAYSIDVLDPGIPC